jgi:single-strand DNA-binding protein|tara:strand:- start:22862 stop:23314 length:453 start_codon:yes stop_codon:yes gene_type:complete
MTTTIQTTGNLGRDPEMKYFESGSCVCKLAMAVKQPGIKQKDGTWKDPETWWVEVELWGKAAERAANKFHKGDTIDARGEAHRETFPRRDGSQGEKLVIKFGTVDLIKAKDESKAATMPPTSQALTPHAAAIAAPPAQAPPVPPSADIPF